MLRECNGDVIAVKRRTKSHENAQLLNNSGDVQLGAVTGL